MYPAGAHVLIAISTIANPMRHYNAYTPVVCQLRSQILGLMFSESLINILCEAFQNRFSECFRNVFV